MSFSDPIADMLTRIRNAVSAGHPNVAMPSSKLKSTMAKILKEEGYMAEPQSEVDGDQPYHKVLREMAWILSGNGAIASLQFWD